jgi:hypothetical protein
MPRGCDHAVHVHIDVVNPEHKARGRAPKAGNRHFIVEFDADGEVLRIKERKKYDHGPNAGSGVYNHPWWKAGTHPLGVLPRRVIAAARLKLSEEHRSANATP